MTPYDPTRILTIYTAGLCAIVILFWAAVSCESPPKEEQPCEPVTIHHFANLDSALQFYAPYTNIISDTSIYRTQIAELRAELLAVTVINGKLRIRLAKAAQDIAGMNQQMIYCRCSPNKPDSIR